MWRVPVMLLGAAVLMGASFAFSEETRAFPTVTIAKSGWAVGPGSNGAYFAGRPITLRVTVRAQSSPALIRLKDHDEYHGTLEFPTSIVIRVLDEDRKVLTRGLENSEWWWGYTYWSTAFEDMPGDVVELLPGEEVVRVVPIDRMLLGCPALEQGLGPGRYVVQLKVDGIPSNELVIEVQPEPVSAGSSSD